MNQYTTEHAILYLQRNSRPRQAAPTEDRHPRRGLRIRHLTTTLPLLLSRALGRQRGEPPTEQAGHLPKKGMAGVEL